MRRSSRLQFALFATAVFFLLNTQVFSQNITYQNPAEFFSCDQASFDFTVQNTTGATLTGVTVTVNFTTTLGTPCGIEYVTGSVTGGVAEGNLSNLSAPQFVVPNLAAGASQSFTISAAANCQTAACVDNAEVFVNEITLNWNGGSTSVTTDPPYVIDRALLVITNVTSTVMTGTRGDVLHRKITIRNTRPAALSSFTFKDVFQPGLSITSPQGTAQPGGPGVFQLLLDGSDFTAIGDGDGLFEFNETLILTEDIEIVVCGVDEHSSVSNISVAWGCDNAVCQQETANAVVTFEPYTKAPQLAWEPIVSVPECFCGPNGYEQGMKITNVGDGKALDITLFVYPQLYDPIYLGGLIDSNSIHVDSLNIPIGFEQNVSGASAYSTPCDGPSSLVENFNVVIASLEPGASVIVHWDLYFCDMSCAYYNRPSTHWEYNYNYFKECPPNVFVSNSIPIPVRKTSLQMNTSAAVLGSILMDGSTYTVLYNVSYDSLSLLDAPLTIEITLPCGMHWVPGNEMLLNGVAPLSIDVVENSTQTMVTAVYDTPLTMNTGTMQFDFLFDCGAICNELGCINELETTCPVLPCVPPGPPGIGGDITTTFSKCEDYPLSCNLNSCTNFGAGIGCPLDTCYDRPPGYLLYDFTALRKNYGLPDNNNDRIPDALSGLPDLNLVKRHRFIPGDTITTTLKGVVVIDEPGKTLPLAYMSIGFSGGNLMQTQTQGLVFSPQNFTAGNSLLRVFDKSTNTWYECPNIPFIDTFAIEFDYDLSALIGNCLPANFVFDQGDSVIFVSDYRLGYNPAPEPDLTPLFGNFIASPSIYLFDADSSDYSLINCKCDAVELELSYYKYNIIPGTFGLPPCQSSAFNTASLVSLQLTEGNFFPFEHRNLLVLEDLHLQVPPSVQLLTTRMINMRLQNGQDIANQVLFPPNFMNGQYVHNLVQPYQTPPLDEGFSALFQYIFDSDCTNKLAMQMEHGVTLNFAPSLPEPVDPLDFTVNTNALRPLIANLSLESPLFNLVSFSNQFQFDFTLKNTPTVVGTLTSGPAPNTWLYVTSQTGLVTNFQLINQTTGQPVPSSNGIFQLGSYPESPNGLPFRLLGLNNSCNVENLQIHYGWNCDPFLNTVQTPCYEKLQLITIESPPGEIDMMVKSPTGCSQLCDTIPYHEIEVFNAQLGSVYDLRVKALVPPGFNVLSGSCEVEYPTGSGLTYPIGDPTSPSTGVFEWNLSMLFDSIATGLPGVGEAPFNSLTLRFLGETTCDFVADAYTLFIAEAKQNCGSPTNSIAKPGDPICIDGVSGPFTMNINVESSPGFGCNNDVGFEVTLSASDTLPPGACLIMTLPTGITYQLNSCTSTCAPGLNCTPTIDGSLVTWQLPAGILPSQLLCLNFNTQGWAGLGCENGVVLFRTAAQTQALCALTGDSCSTKVSTGSLILPFDPQRPEYDLSNFKINATASGANDLINFTVDVTNNDADNLPPLAIEFYLDTDGNGTGDQLVHTENYGSVIAAGATTTVSGSFTLPSATNLCALIALIDASQQCACAGDQIQVSTPIAYQTGLSWTVCSGADQQIGVTPMPGFDYQWSPDDCLADDQAPTTIFNCVNNGFNPVEYQFTLSEGNGFCEINNLMSVTLQPVPGIAYADSPICQGQSANLAATDGSIFSWQGPGIAQPNQQIITVTPTSTSQYSVMVTDAVGCMGADTVTVVVATIPTANAGADLNICPGQSAQLNATTAPGYTYLWSPQTAGGQPALSNPTIPNPTVLTSQNTTFTLEVFSGNCSNTDEVTVNFLDSLLLTMPPDVTICLGNSATLAATTNVPATFAWSPDGNCVNPPSCSSLLVSPTTTTTYTANAITPDGCPATGTVTVTVVTDQIVETGPAVEICEGESTVIFGETVSQPGIYCDTFAIAGGCDSLYCVELLVKPQIDTLQFETTVCFGESVIFEGETFTEEGLHCVTFPGSNGCDSTRCIQIDVLDSISIVFNLPDTVKQGDSLMLTIPDGFYTSIQWFANDSLLADCNNSYNCEVIAMENTTYSVVVVDTFGCSGSAAQSVFVLLGCDPQLVEIPNVFSPNGDSRNDSFNIVGPGSEAILNMRIWNRWGEKVFDGAGPWNGKQNGKDAPSDVYIYLIRIGCAVPVEDMERVVKGDVTLLR